MSLKVIQIASNEVGYLEKQSNSQLDSYTGNAGYNNWTKYARDLDALGDFYNGKKNGYEWCDMFVDWCFLKAYGKDWAMKLLNQPKYSAGAGCTYSLQYYQQIGRFYTSNPKHGDQIFFGSVGNSTHTGLVEKVDSKYVYTIEGNTSGASGVVSNGGGVCRKTYPLSSSYIAGYGRPDYSQVNDYGDILLELEEENMTQERFNEMMTEYLKALAMEKPSTWSAEARAWAEREGIINGDANGNRMYKKFLTREEAAQILFRIHGKE